MELVAYDWIVLTLGLFGLMLYTSKTYKDNPFVHGFWLLLGNWYYVVVLIQFEETTYSFGILLMVLNTLINIFYIQCSMKHIIGNKR